MNTIVELNELTIQQIGAAANLIIQSRELDGAYVNCLIYASFIKKTCYDSGCTKFQQVNELILYGVERHTAPLSIDQLNQLQQRELKLQAILRANFVHINCTSLH